jgi:ferredoxin-NADP reductase
VATIQAFKTHLLEKIPRTGDIVSFSFERPLDHEYQAGQWFVMTFPGLAGAPREGAQYVHHFSYSSSPTEPRIEFTTRLRGSEFKNALDRLSVGAEVEWEGPFGGFTLAPRARRVAFLTGGIGITCVRSILRWLADTTAPAGAAATAGVTGRERPLAPVLEDVTLLFANRCEDTIPFRDELRELENSLPALRVVNVISQSGEGWAGYSGHIDPGVLTKELPEPQTWAYYLSGPPSLVQTMQQLLVGWGIGTEAMKSERFEGYE